jgi:hypothetical protein
MLLADARCGLAPKKEDLSSSNVCISKPILHTEKVICPTTGCFKMMGKFHTWCVDNAWVTYGC